MYGNTDQPKRPGGTPGSRLFVRTGASQGTSIDPIRNSGEGMMTICRGLLAPALLVPMLGLAIPANAQQSPGVFQCSASAVAPQIRAEGETELVADIVVNCTGGTPTVAGTNVPTADITVSLNTVVASRLMGNNPGSEALLPGGEARSE